MHTNIRIQNCAYKLYLHTIVCARYSALILFDIYFYKGMFWQDRASRFQVRKDRGLKNYTFVVFILYALKCVFK